MKSVSMTIHMNAAKQYFPVVLFFTLCKMFLSFESADEIFTSLESPQMKAMDVVHFLNTIH